MRSETLLLIGCGAVSRQQCWVSLCVNFLFFNFVIQVTFLKIWTLLGQKMVKIKQGFFWMGGTDGRVYWCCQQASLKRRWKVVHLKLVVNWTVIWGCFSYREQCQTKNSILISCIWFFFFFIFVSLDVQAFPLFFNNCTMQVYSGSNT